MNKKAVIYGFRGHQLSKREKSFFKKTQPWGLILFSRNIKNIYQLKKLTKDIKKTFKDKNYPILIDMEGGKVSRLNNIIDFSCFTQKYFTDLFKKNKKIFLNYYNIYINTVCNILNEAGVNINTVPVLDVIRANSHEIIGNRSFSKNVNEVIKMGNLCIDFYKKHKIATVIKHIPGHGLSKFDSHYKTPIIQASKKELIKKDFKAFKLCKSPFAMTCHAIYSSYDSNNTATHSKLIINKVIRKHIKFKGILISDDISMKSLKFTLEENAKRALEAGCNLILHCNGNLNQMKKLSKVIPKIDKFTWKKTSDFYNFLR